MNVFLNHLSMSYPDDIIILVCDGAAWHKAKALKIPKNIRLIFIPPYTPEMNPIEQCDSEHQQFSGAQRTTRVNGEQANSLCHYKRAGISILLS